MVTGGELPRFAYTIGCKNILGSEFVFAGGESYSKFDVSKIISESVILAKEKSDWKSIFIEVASIGYFSLSKVDKSWSELLILGAFDYYNQADIQVWQILPDKNHSTLDVPDMSQIFDVDSQPVWQWLSRDWNYPVPNNSMSFTNLKVLFGEKATEVMRWEKDEWEIFSGAGPDVSEEDRRIVPLGVLIGIDASLKPAIFLEVGKGLWRDKVELEWNSWG